MKLLIFEFITGGGFSQQELPKSLLNEGRLMLDALIADLICIESLDLTLLLDWRCQHIVFPDKINIIWVSKTQNIDDLLPNLIDDVDLVWPIAPEIDQALTKISIWVESKGKRLVNSSSKAVEICSDKLLTIQTLHNNGLPVVTSTQLDRFVKTMAGEWVIKPKDGAGCLDSYFITNQHEFDRALSLISQPENYIIQPYRQGESLSLSCLFKDGKAELICCNRQQVSINKGVFELKACEVNISTNQLERYQKLIDKAAQSISGLWGYVGIDLIQPDNSDPLILEINPRLTTSYVGIYPATGINIGRAVIDMLGGDVKPQKTKDLPYNIDLL